MEPVNLIRGMRDDLSGVKVLKRNMGGVKYLENIVGGVSSADVWTENSSSFAIILQVSLG